MSYTYTTKVLDTDYVGSQKIWLLKNKVLNTEFIAFAPSPFFPNYLILHWK